MFEELVDEIERNSVDYGYDDYDYDDAYDEDYDDVE
jgi:hypothetical protein